MILVRILIVAIVCIIESEWRRGVGVTASEPDEAKRGEAFPCHSNRTCSKLVAATTTFCQNGFCVCFELESSNSIDNNSVAMVACEARVDHIRGKIYDPCPCTMANSYCDAKRNKCKCLDHFIPNNDRRACIKEIVPLDGACEFHDQCLKYDTGAICDPVEKVCRCSEHFVMVYGACHSRISIGERCQSTDECRAKTPHAICTDHRCVCEHNYVSDTANMTCLPAVGYGGECKETRQCLKQIGPGSVCDSGACVCSSNHYKYTAQIGGGDSGQGSRIFCERAVYLGDACLEHNECFTRDAHEQSMECEDNHCVCMDGFVEQDRVHCVQSSAQFVHAAVCKLMIHTAVFSVIPSILVPLLFHVHWRSGSI